MFMGVVWLGERERTRERHALTNTEDDTDKQVCGVREKNCYDYRCTVSQVVTAGSEPAMEH